MTKQTLEQQVVAALTVEPAPPLDQLLTLISEVESGIVAADNEVETSTAAFYDPIACPDIHRGRDVMETAVATAARLRTLLPKLQDRARQVRLAADREAWQTDFDRLAEERNALAKELAQLYPKVEAQLVSLFARISANDSALSALHGSRPDGAKGFLLGAELAARGLDAFTRDEPSITRELQIPSWTELCRLSWPPRELPAGVLLAESMPTSDHRRHSANWFEAAKEDNARRVAEEQRRIAEEQQRSERAKRQYEESLPR